MVMCPLAAEQHSGEKYSVMLNRCRDEKHNTEEAKHTIQLRAAAPAVIRTSSGEAKSRGKVCVS